MKARFTFLFAILLLPFSAFASFNWNWNLNPYVGIDGAWRHMDWAKGFGEGHFDKDYQNGSAFLGLQLNEYLAVEGGYQRTNRVQKQQFYFGDDDVGPILGFVPPQGDRDSRLFISDAEMRGMHFSLLGLWPVNEETTIFGLLGAAWNRFYVSTVAIRNRTVLGDGRSTQQVIRWESQREPVIRLGIGLSQAITKRFRGRIFLIWEDTSRLAGSSPGNDVDNGVAILNPGLVTDAYTAKSKPSTLLGIGFSYHFLKKQSNI